MKQKNSLLPSNASDLELALEQALIFAPSITISDLWQADVCPVDFLPALAAQYGDIYLEQSWSEQTKRKVLQQSFNKHQIIGTRKSLIDALSPFGLVLAINEWFNDPFAPKATFSIDFALTEQGMDAAAYTQIMRIIDNTRPAAKHLSALNINLAVRGTIYAANKIFKSETVTVYPKPVTNINNMHAPFIITACDCSPPIIEIFPLH